MFPSITIHNIDPYQNPKQDNLENSIKNKIKTSVWEKPSKDNSNLSSIRKIKNDSNGVNLDNQLIKNKMDYLDLFFLSCINDKEKRKKYIEKCKNRTTWYS